MSTISIIGSGGMATAIAGRTAKAGHTVKVVSRDAAKARALADQLAAGTITGRRPTAADIALIIEIASDEARLKDDKNKAETYASVRVPEYWIVDLLHRNVLVHREPQDTVYTFLETKRPGETIVSAVVDGFAIAVDLLLRHASGAKS